MKANFVEKQGFKPFNLLIEKEAEAFLLHPLIGEVNSSEIKSYLSSYSLSKVEEKEIVDVSQRMYTTLTNVFNPDPDNKMNSFFGEKKAGEK